MEIYVEEVRKARSGGSLQAHVPTGRFLGGMHSENAKAADLMGLCFESSWECEKGCQSIWQVAGGGGKEYLFCI